jgi:hypothetical protein
VYFNPVKKRFTATVISLLLVFFAAAQVDSTQVTATDSLNNDSLDTNFNLPTFSTTSDDMGDNIQSQDINSLLQASRDVFMQTVANHFITARFRYRGYSSEDMVVMMNGVRINSLENGIAGWSTWGGMNDVIRFMETKTGLGLSRSTFGDIGGYYNLNVYASSYKKGVRVSYSRGNRIFKDRVTATYSTGLMKNGWAFTASGTARYANEGYFPGTFFQGYGYYLAADKQLNSKHTLSLIGFGAPITQGRQAMSTDEAFELTGDKYYNSFWGFQTDSTTGSVKARNSRVSSTNRPSLLFSHAWTLDQNTKITTSLNYTFGRTSLTGLNWFDAPNPRPDYYSYLPSYYNAWSSYPNPAMYNQVKYNWEHNVGGIQQVKWDEFYNANYMNLYMIKNASGIEGNNVVGRRSRYIVEERRDDITSFGLNSIYNTRIKTYFISAGLNANMSKTRHYKVLNDLLGGDFWLDVDQFAEQLSPDPLVIQNNIDEPNKPVKKGDVFGFDYNINASRYEGWGQVEKTFNRFELYAAFSLNSTSFYRDGHIVNGKFMTSSGGRSDKLSFFNYGVKAGGIYKLNGRNFLLVNAAYITKPPLPNASFVSVQTRNHLIRDIARGYGNEEVLSGELTYQVKYPFLRARATYYYSQINNQVWLRNYFDDVYKTNVNYFMSGLNQLNQGVELGVEGTIRKRVIVSGVLAEGQFIYTNRPSATISADNSAQLLATNRTIYFKNYRVGNMPQRAASAGLRYNSAKYWFVGINYNYFANNYVEANPDRRTAEAIEKFVATDPQYSQIVDQEKLPNAYTVDFIAGKSFLFKRKYGLNLTLIINNLTNNQFKNSGIEQLRHDVNNIDKFPNRYAYAMGLSYMLTAAFTIR